MSSLTAGLNTTSETKVNAMCDLEEVSGYVARIHAEHLKLQSVVQCIQQNWQELGRSVIRALLELRKTLSLHFNLEDFACFEEAVGRCPKLGPEVDRIEREHSVLLAELEGIIRQWRSGNDVQADFRVFADNLRAHECAENRILQIAFGIEIER
jgi:hypothetical protein